MTVRSNLENTDVQNMSGKQEDLRFGTQGRTAWIYWMWPGGPLPVAGLFIWGVTQAVQSPEKIGLLIFFSIGFVFATWLCSMEIMMSIEGCRAVQRVFFNQERVWIKPFFGRSFAVCRNIDVSVEPYWVSRAHLWTSMGTTFMSLKNENFRICIPTRGVYLMNGEEFDPKEIFPSARMKG